jgi:hypothetical protein
MIPNFNDVRKVHFFPLLYSLIKPPNTGQLIATTTACKNQMTQTFLGKKHNMTNHVDCFHFKLMATNLGWAYSPAQIPFVSSDFQFYTLYLPFSPQNYTVLPSPPLLAYDLISLFIREVQKSEEIPYFPTSLSTRKKLHTCVSTFFSYLFRDKESLPLSKVHFALGLSSSVFWRILHRNALPISPQQL